MEKYSAHSCPEESYKANEVERKLIFAIKVIRIMSNRYHNEEADKAADELSAEINYY